MSRFLLLIAFLAFASVPMVIGNAETKGSEKSADAKQDPKANESKKDAKESKDSVTKEAPKDSAKDEARAEKSDKTAKDDKSDKNEKSEKAAEEKVAEHKRSSGECLASEEVIQDLETRENKIKEREDALVEKEKSLSTQETAIKEELAKLETARGEVQGIHAKALADREEKVNKLMETLESMSPKAAAAVLNGVDDELAVTALSRLTSVKAGKVLSNLNAEKSARLSEIMAYGQAVSRKEKTHAESSERAPASKR